MSELTVRRRVVGSVVFLLLGVVVTALLGVQLQAVHRILVTTGTTTTTTTTKVGGEPPPQPSASFVAVPGTRGVRQRTAIRQQQPPPQQPPQQEPPPPQQPAPPLPPPPPQDPILDEDSHETALLPPPPSPEAPADRPPVAVVGATTATATATTTATLTTTGAGQVLVLPHVFDRRTTSSTSTSSQSGSSKSESLWDPSLTGLRDLNDVDEQFFYDASWKGTTKATNATTNASDATPPSNAPLHRPIDPTLPHREFLGFIRITKTASSSIVRFLQRARNVHASNNFVHFDELYRIHQLSNGGGPTVSGHPQAPPCFFSRHSNLTWTPPPKHLGPWNCHHFAYSHLVMNWAKSLQYLNDQLMEDVPPSVSAGELSSSSSSSLQIKFRIFTIVRDPYDRMVSYYHFWRKIYPDWLASTPPKLLTRLVAGDVPGWMEYRANTSVPNLDAAHQYLYLSQDVDRAIRLVTAYTPVPPSTPHADTTTTQQQVLRIVPLVSECFDASVTLLVELFPNVLERGSEREFLASSAKKFNERIEPKPELGMAPVRDYNSTWLRERSLEWFPDEYRFYDAAVRQFRKLLAASSTIDPEVVRSCLTVLDEREATRRPARAPPPESSSSSSSLPAAASS